jgi:hypothetical protein
MNHLDINPLTNKHQWIDSQLLPLVQAKERRKEAALPSAVTKEPGTKRVPKLTQHRISSLHLQSCSLNLAQMSLPNSRQSPSD